MDIRQNPGGVKAKTNALTDHVRDLVHSYYELGLLNVTDKASGIASYTIVLLMVTLLSLFTLLFLCFGLGWWLGQQLNNMLAGFSLVALLFVALIGLILAFRKQVLFPFIRNSIIKKVYE